MGLAEFILKFICYVGLGFIAYVISLLGIGFFVSIVANEIFGAYYKERTKYESGHYVSKEKEEKHV